MSRFSEPPDPVFQRLDSSIGFDWRLGPYDVAQSRAHATMLAAAGIIADEERDELLRGLDQVACELEDGSFPFEPDDVDIHMAVERRLTAIVGPGRAASCTPRARATTRWPPTSRCSRARTRSARSTACARCRRRCSTSPSATSTGRCPATRTSSAPSRSTSRTTCSPTSGCSAATPGASSSCSRSTEELPLGAGALAGVNFATDRGLLASELGFAAVAPNSIDAVSNRDFVLDYLAAAATCATHLSRLGAEIVLWSSEEFGFCEVSDAWASGSSIMPQKKNPDAAELLRAKAPRVTAHLVGLHGVMHGLPLTYNKDLQEDKEHLFDCVDTLDLTLAAARGMLSGIAFRRERLAAAAADEMIAATDVADLLVRRGVPFRQSHGIVAGLVRETLEAGRSLSGAHPRGARAPLA